MTVHRFPPQISGASILADSPVFLDTETTGLGADDVIVELAIIDTNGHALFESLVWTDKVLDAEVIAVHGITNAMLAAAPRWEELAPRVNALLAGRTIVCHNAEFDARMLAQTAAGAGVGGPTPEKYVCSMELVRPHFPGRQHVSLKRAMQTFGVAAHSLLGRAHRAAYDARCCRALVNAVAWSESPVAA